MPTEASIQTRLDAYYAAELEILTAQEMRNNDKTHRMADLVVIQSKIELLERQLGRKQRSDDDEHTLGFSKANLNRQ